MPNAIEIKAMSVAASTSISASVHLKGRVPVAVVTPATLAANSAVLVWEGSPDNSTYTLMYDEFGNLLKSSVSTTAARWIVLDPADFLGAAYIRFRVMRTSGLTAVTQGAKTFNLHVRPIE